jgi:hypothetical protein
VKSDVLRYARARVDYHRTLTQTVQLYFMEAPVPAGHRLLRGDIFGEYHAAGQSRRVSISRHLFSS